MRAPRTKAQKQYVIVERARFNAQKALDRLDYEEETILPGLERIEAIEATGETLNFNITAKPLEIEGV